ncbi:succinylglutamate desuccinylase/aspartoacylase family protein [bacterium]|nr:succinylglutamate desuccinylase/aspartoacylase family protein [bacterium]
MPHVRSGRILIPALAMLAASCASPTTTAPGLAGESSEKAPVLNRETPTETNAPDPLRASTAGSAEPPAPPPDTAGSEPAVWDVIGTSVLGEPLEAISLGSGPTRIYVLGGIHGDEDAGARWARLLALHLDANLPDGLTIRVLEDANPDGTASGTRGNSHGVDLNRNWPSTDFIPGESHGPEPLSEPETTAVHADLVAFDPHFVIAVHEARQGPFANFDGPGVVHALRFAAAAREHDIRWRVEPEVWWPTPGSLGTWFGGDLGIPVLTVEFLRGIGPSDARPILFDGIDAVLAGIAADTIPDTGNR